MLTEKEAARRADLVERNRQGRGKRRAPFTPEHKANLSAALRGVPKPHVAESNRRRRTTPLLYPKPYPYASFLPPDLVVTDVALLDRLRRRKRQGATDDELRRFVSAARAGVCECCGKPETRKQKGVLTPLSFDHDHKTGRYRGALCCGCNLLLGHGLDDADILRAAISYLERTR